MDKVFTKVLSIIQEYTEISSDRILKDKHEECVDYRILLIEALHRVGISDQAIADRLQLTRQGVNYLRNKFKQRIKFSYNLSSIWKEIEKELKSIY